jgi:hypothetical protein
MSKAPDLPARDLSKLAADIHCESAAAEANMRQGYAHAVAAGRMLLEAKPLVGHGGWLEWIEKTCRVSVRSAQRYMQVARDLPKLDEANATRVAEMSLRDALQLGAKTTRMLAPMEPEQRAATLAATDTAKGVSGTLLPHRVARVRVAAARATMAAELSESRASVVSVALTVAGPRETGKPCSPRSGRNRRSLRPRPRSSGCGWSGKTWPDASKKTSGDDGNCTGNG